MFPLSIISPLNSNVTLPLIQSQPLSSAPVLSLPKQTYEDYLAFLFENNDQLSSDNHLAFLQKEVFDDILETFHDQELSILQEKQDMYMYYIMYSTFYVLLRVIQNTGKISHENFIIHIDNLSQFYSLASDQILLTQQIQQIVQKTLLHQESPFSYLQACHHLFSQKLLLKLTDILKFMIGDSLCYKMNPASIFGLCLDWMVHKHQITNQTIKELIEYLIDLKSPCIAQKMTKLQEIMSQIINLNKSK